MQILVTSFSIGPRTGGLRVGVLGLCRGLSSRGHQVSLFTTNADEGEVLNVPLGVPTFVEGVEVFYYPVQKVIFGNVLSFAMVKAFKHRVPNVDLVLIHSMYQLTSTVAAHYCRKFRVPYVVRPHGILDPTLARRRRWLLKWVYIQLFEKRNLNSAAAIQYSSQMEVELAHNFIDIKSPDLLIPEGVSLKPYEELPLRGSFRSKYPEMAGKSLILHLGRIHQKKGIELLIEAFSMAAVHRDDAHLVLAGAGDSDYVMRINKLILDFGVSKRTTITGQLSDFEKLAVLSDADVFALPSYGENFGISVVEAMACGLPVVISDNVGIWRDIKDGDAGIVTKCRPDKIALAVEKLLDDPSLRTAMGLRGKALVDARFSADRMSKSMDAAFQAICGVG